LTGAFFLLACSKTWEAREVITRQSDGFEQLAAASSCGMGIRHPRLAKLALLASTALVLVVLYIATKHFLSIEGVTAEQTRAFSVDIGESCLQGTAEPPVFDAREGDRIALTVTSLYSGALYIHGMEKELNLTPGSEARITFTAEHAGRYYLHLHGEDQDHAHAEAAVLEVAPR
jgi:hypothetical protein